MFTAFLVDEITGRRYHLYRMMSIGASSCDIELNDSTIPTMRLFHPSNQNFVYLLCGSDDIIGRITNNGNRRLLPMARVRPCSPPLNEDS